MLSPLGTYLDTRSDCGFDPIVSNCGSSGIHPRDYDNPKRLFDVYSIIRYLDEQHLAVFRATGKELSMCLPDGMPQLMYIDQWHYLDYTK